MSAERRMSISNNEVSKDGDERNQARNRGFSDISAEDVKLPKGKYDGRKVRSQSRSDLYG